MTRQQENTRFEEKEFLISFSDLTGYNKLAQALEDKETFRLLSGYHRIVSSEVEKAGGILVKFIGDAAMIAFTAEKTDEGIKTLLVLKQKADSYFEKKDIKHCRLMVKAHYGLMISAISNNRMDFFGKNVNAAATLKTNGFAITPQVFRKLSPATRKLFKKHTPQVTYIPVTERHI